MIDDRDDEIEGRPIIFTTGTFLSPRKFTLENGEIWWGWSVERFEDDSYVDGELFNPPELARKKVELLMNQTPLYNDDQQSCNKLPK